ncbi:MAG: malate synthase A, partial [Myxococcales bacterium]|nr:malate synthase A [Myxococcales bacterium]
MTFRFVAPQDPTSDALLREALPFLGRLVHRFAEPLDALLQERAERQAAFDGGALPGFREGTRAIREGDWRVDPVPE